MLDRRQAGLLPALTGLRFVAAMAIFALHFLPEPPASWAPAWQHTYKTLRDAGVSGVAMFFALSGFILTHAHLDMRRDRASVLRFYVNRLARIYPVYLLGMLWFAPFALYHRFSTETASLAWTKILVGWAVSLPLVQTWFHPMLALSWNGPGWSLSVEFVFYLLFPLMLPAVRSLRPAGLGVLMAGALALSLFWSWLMPRWLGAWPHAAALVDFGPLAHLPTFVFGMALGAWFHRRPQVGWLSHLLAPMGALLYLVLALAIPEPGHVLHNTLMLPAFGLIFMGLAKGGLGTAILSNRYMVKLGEASYGLYILQFGMAMTFAWLVSGLRVQDYWGDFNVHLVRDFPFFAGLVAFCVVLSLLSHRWVEAPGRERLRAALLRRWLPVASAPAEAGGQSEPERWRRVA